MEQGTCIRCGMELVGGSRYPDLCKECERSMSEEEIFAIMDSA